MESPIQLFLSIQDNLPLCKQKERLLGLEHLLVPLSVCPTDQYILPPHLYPALSPVRGKAKTEGGMPFIVVL